MEISLVMWWWSPGLGNAHGCIASFGLVCLIDRPNSTFTIPKPIPSIFIKSINSVLALRTLPSLERSTTSPLTTNSGRPKEIRNCRRERLGDFQLCEIVKIRIGIEMRFDIIRDGVQWMSPGRERFMKFRRSIKVWVSPKNVRKPASSGFPQHFRKGPYLWEIALYVVNYSMYRSQMAAATGLILLVRRWVGFALRFVSP